MARQLERERMPYAALLASILKAGIASVAGERDRAAESLRAAIDLAWQTDMALHGLAAKYQLGVLTGGDLGEELVRAAADAMQAQGIRDPGRFANVLVPGRWKTT